MQAPKPEDAKAADKPADPAAAAKTASDAPATQAGVAKTKKVTKDSKRQEDWGELATGKQPPRVFVLAVATGAIAAVPGQQEGHSYGQPHWTPDGRLLVVRRTAAAAALAVFVSCAVS